MREGWPRRVGRTRVTAGAGRSLVPLGQRLGRLWLSSPRLGGGGAAPPEGLCLPPGRPCPTRASGGGASSVRSGARYGFVTFVICMATFSYSILHLIVTLGD